MTHTLQAGPYSERSHQPAGKKLLFSVNNDPHEGEGDSPGPHPSPTGAAGLREVDSTPLWENEQHLSLHQGQKPAEEGRGEDLLNTGFATTAGDKVISSQWERCPFLGSYPVSDAWPRSPE